jgi:DNA-binding NtrC family response regulator
MSAGPAIALVIDDEAMVRQLVRRILDPDVCHVIEAGDGEAGLRLIERSRDDIDVVLTDLLMPGIDGYDVVEVLAEHYPDLPVACMSGFASHTSVGRQLTVPIIPKPFNAESLRALLQPLIAQAQGIRARAAVERHAARDQLRLARELRRRSDATRALSLDLVAAVEERRRRRAAEQSKG